MLVPDHNHPAASRRTLPRVCVTREGLAGAGDHPLDPRAGCGAWRETILRYWRSHRHRAGRTLAVSLGLAAAACGGGDPGELPAIDRPVEVSVSRTVASHGVTTLPATVVAEERAQLATRISGTIRSVPVDIGTGVSVGQALLSLDTDEIDARIASAKAAAELARQYHARIAPLAEDGAATEQELDDAAARLEMAEAGLRDARAQRDYVVLRAPFSGVVTARMADPGDLAKPGVPVLELIGSGALEIQADLPADLAGRLSVGEDVMVYRPETGARHRARITRVVPAVEPASRRFRVEARFETTGADAPNVPPGAFVRLEMRQPETMTRWIPADAIVRRGQLSGVYTVEGDRLRLRWVRLGRQLDGTVELLAGPGLDVALVRKPESRLMDGQPVSSVRQVDWAPPFDQDVVARMEGGR